MDSWADHALHPGKPGCMMTCGAGDHVMRGHAFHPGEPGCMMTCAAGEHVMGRPRTYPGKPGRMITCTVGARVCQRADRVWGGSRRARWTTGLTWTSTTRRRSDTARTTRAPANIAPWPRTSIGQGRRSAIFGIGTRGPGVPPNDPVGPPSGISSAWSVPPGRARSSDRPRCRRPVGRPRNRPLSGRRSLRSASRRPCRS